jgi:hypothetical protein
MEGGFDFGTKGAYFDSGHTFFFILFVCSL